MKILMLGWELPPHNSGGLGVACYGLCKALAHRGVDIEFVLPYHDKHDIDFMKITPAFRQNARVLLAGGGAYDSYRYIHPDGREEWLDIYGQVKAYEHAVSKLAEETEFDIVHAHDWLTFRAGLRAKMATGAPLILHVHSIERDRAGGNLCNPLVREIEETAMLMADAVFAVSQLTKDAIVADYGIPADKIHVVHNHLNEIPSFEHSDDTMYAYLAAMKSQGYKVVTNVGRLTVQKGLPNLLRAARIVVDHEPKTFFLIVGGGEMLHELIQLSADLGLGRNVLFAGFQRGQAWRDAFSIADLFVMPSVSEPFGLTPLESIGFGTPALISKQSGVSEVLQNALKVDFWDIERMADQITSVIQNPALPETLQHNALREIRGLHWGQSAEKVTNLYQRYAAGVMA
ncbi:glycosyltransferase family 1 protein [Candidatus Saccharibacteria bacterium]|nr:MAG: glycosyltransferase family 1 protein [Candidatus Saccharibacteria bacterium]